jgi:hypothetical protein
MEDKSKFLCFIYCYSYKIISIVFGFLVDWYRNFNKVSVLSSSFCDMVVCQQL